MQKAETLTANPIDMIMWDMVDISNESAENIRRWFENIKKLWIIKYEKIRLLLLKALKEWVDIETFMNSLPEHLKQFLSSEVLNGNKMPNIDNKYRWFQENNPNFISSIADWSQEYKNNISQTLEEVNFASLWKTAETITKWIFNFAKEIWSLVPFKKTLLMATILYLVLWTPTWVLELLKLGPQIAATAPYDTMKTLLWGLSFEEFFENIPNLIELFAWKPIWNMPWV